MPCAMGLSLAAVMMVTIDPFAALAIAGMSFRVGCGDCATTMLRSKEGSGKEVSSLCAGPSALPRL